VGCCVGYLGHIFASKIQKVRGIVELAYCDPNSKEIKCNINVSLNHDGKLIEVSNLKTTKSRYVAGGSVMLEYPNGEPHNAQICCKLIELPKILYFVGAAISVAAVLS
jgi:hypothetical protein